MSAAYDQFKKVVGISEPLTDEDAKALKVLEEKEKAEAAKAAESGSESESNDSGLTIIKGKANEVKGKVKDMKNKISGKKDTTEANAKSEESDDDSIIKKVAQAEETDTVVRKTAPTEEEKNMATEMRSMDFYSKAGNAIYDVDRGLGMDGQLRSWIIDQFSKDADLRKEVLRTLPSIIEKNPKIVPSIKEMIKDAAEANVPYIVTYLSKIDDNEYEDRAEAEAAGAEMAKRLGLEPSKTIKLVYHKLKADGSIGAKISRGEVEEFVTTFDGDKDKLRKELHLPNPSTKKSQKKADKPTAGDDDDKPATAASAG